MRVADALVRMALRLSTVGVLGPVAQMVLDRTLSLALVVIAIASGGVVAALLFLADVIGAIGIASGIVGLLLALGLWAWYLWDTHRHPAPSPGEKTGEHT